MRYKNLGLLIVLLFPIASMAQDMARHFKVFDVKNQKTTSIDAIVKEMNNADVLFFGEEHNDSIGHYLESEIFRKMIIAYPGKIALTMEMFHTDVQPTINEYLMGIISEKNFIKEARAWNNYKDYKPMIELAKANKLDV
ncbi:MAG: ChaN family lipoprotein, partial [Bacteroidia bacterium]